MPEGSTTPDGVLFYFMEYWRNLDLADIEYVCEVTGENLTEQWKDVLGYEGHYIVSDLGRVKSVCREIYREINRCNSVLKPRMLMQSNCGGGYLGFTACKNNKKRTIHTHLMMAVVFFNHTPSRLMVVDHKNNNPFDNRLSNFQIITHRRNSSKDRKTSASASKYVGVTFRKDRQMWESSISINNQGQIKILYTNNEDYAGLSYIVALENVHEFTGCNKTFRKLIKDKTRIRLGVERL